MLQPYVSDYENFINEFMTDHPHEFVEQRKGWSDAWLPDLHPSPTPVTKDQIVRDDQYGFH